MYGNEWRDIYGYMLGKGRRKERGKRKKVRNVEREKRQSERGERRR